MDATKIFNDIFGLIPNKDKVWIAGGAAVDLNKASDIDIWFGGNDIVEASKFLSLFPYREMEIVNQEYGQDASTTVIGNGWNPQYSKPVQVMTTKFDKIDDLINTFDISSHRWWYHFDSGFSIGSGGTFNWEPPKVHKIGKTTFTRYIKICKRYGHEPDPKVLSYIMSGGLDMNELLSIPEPIKAVPTNMASLYGIKE